MCSSDLTGVTKRTGLSGDIQVATTVDPGRGVVRVSVGSTDTRKAGKTSKPVVVYVHRPGRLSMIERKATHEDFASGKAKHSPKGQNLPGYGVVRELNPKASDGKYLLAELVRKPGARVVKTAIVPKLGAKIAARVARG